MLKINTTTTRCTNFELLRIFEMIGIVLFHSLCHGKYIVNDDTVNNYFIRYMQVTGEVGVNIFVIISGVYNIGGGIPPVINKIFGSLSQ